MGGLKPPSAEEPVQSGRRRAAEGGCTARRGAREERTVRPVRNPRRGAEPRRPEGAVSGPRAGPVDPRAGSPGRCAREARREGKGTRVGPGVASKVGRKLCPRPPSGARERVASCPGSGSPRPARPGLGVVVGWTTGLGWGVRGGPGPPHPGSPRWKTPELGGFWDPPHARPAGEASFPGTNLHFKAPSGVN